MFRYMAFGVALSLSITAVRPVQAQGSSPLAGAWRVVEYTGGAGGATNRSPQPGLFLFTMKHYAIVRDSSERARPTFKDRANITADEALAIFGPFQAQAGTYEVVGDVLTTRIVAAKSPHNAGGTVSDTYRFSLEGNVLTLTMVTDSGVPVQRRSIFKLIRLE